MYSFNDKDERVGRFCDRADANSEKAESVPARRVGLPNYERTAGEPNGLRGSKPLP
jgi:hypothetical protein